MPIPHPTVLPPVRTPEELSARWRLLLADAPDRDPDDAGSEDADPAGRSARRTDLWVQTYDADGRQQPPLIVVEDVPDVPDASFVANLAGMLGDVLAEETAVSAPMPEMDRKRAHFRSANLLRSRNTDGEASR